MDYYEEIDLLRKELKRIDQQNALLQKKINQLDNDPQRLLHEAQKLLLLQEDHTMIRFIN